MLAEEVMNRSRKRLQYICYKTAVSDMNATCVSSPHLSQRAVLGFGLKCSGNPATHGTQNRSQAVATANHIQKNHCVENDPNSPLQ